MTSLTKRELSDIKKLDARRNKSKDTPKFDNKKSGAEIVAQKRIDEERARKNLGLKKFGRIKGKQGRSKLFANQNFDLGLPSSATQADRDRVIARKQERTDRNARIRANRELKKKRETIGRELLKQFGSTSRQQKISLRKKGIKLNGTLNAVAIAKLRERGLI